MTNKHFNFAYAITLPNIRSVIAYIVEIYGKEIYLKPHQFIGLLADIHIIESNYLKLYRRAIIEYNIAQKIYYIVKNKSGNILLIQKLELQLRESDFLSKDISNEVISNLVSPLIEISSTVNSDDDISLNLDDLTVYSIDGRRLIRAPKTTGDKYEIMNGVEVICNGAFKDHVNLKAIKIPSSVIKIGDWAFSGCASLQRVDIPESVMSIGDNAFSNCSQLSYIHVPNLITDIKKCVFSNCFSLEDITLPRSLRIINDFAFSNCPNLQKVVIHNSLIKIGFGAFEKCENLNIINLPGTLEEIESLAFRNCTNLREVNITSLTIKIGVDAFKDCNNLGELKTQNKEIKPGYFNHFESFEEWMENLADIKINELSINFTKNKDKITMSSGREPIALICDSLRGYTLESILDSIIGNNLIVGIPNKLSNSKGEPNLPVIFIDMSIWNLVDL